MHDVIIVGVFLFAIHAGIFKDLRSDMQGRFNKSEGYLDRIDADPRHLYHFTGRLEARMDSFGK